MCMFSAGYGARDLNGGSKYITPARRSWETEVKQAELYPQFAGLTEEQQAFIGGIGALTRLEAETVNKCFPAVLFYRREKNRMECTCTGCHRRFTVEREREWPWESSEEERALWNLRHNDTGRCPSCGAKVVLKSAGRGRNSWGFVHDRFVIFRGGADDVTAFTVWAKKDFRQCDDPAVEYYIDRYIWRFRPGKAECFAATHGARGVILWRRTKKPVNPWPNPSWCHPDTSWWAILEDETICRSFLRYADVKERGIDRLRYYYAYAKNPKCELLDKAGLTKLVDAMADGKTQARLIDWKQTKPLAAFGLTKQEYGEWAKTQGDPAVLKAFRERKRRGEPVTMEEVIWLCGDSRRAGWCSVTGQRPRRIKSYLDKQTAAYLYRDYLDMAQKLGMDVTREQIAFPKNLRAAHDRYAEAERAMLEEQRRQKEEKEREAFEESFSELEKKYGFAWGDYFIRPANCASEIIAEGKAMCNCIAGYAERHIQGKLCICFLRRASEPEKPYVDIEMRDGKMIQCHGYQNDRGAEKKPTELHADMLNAWLAWIAAGSKRDKNGNPKMKKQKTKEKKAA